MRNFRNYNIWKDSVSFTTEIYKIVRDFPSYERYGLGKKSICIHFIKYCRRISKRI